MYSLEAKEATQLQYGAELKPALMQKERRLLVSAQIGGWNLSVGQLSPLAHPPSLLKGNTIWKLVGLAKESFLTRLVRYPKGLPSSLPASGAIFYWQVLRGRFINLKWGKTLSLLVGERGPFLCPAEGIAGDGSSM